MCGICGQLNFDPTNPVNPHLIREMAQVLQHRGPNDEGIWVHKNIGLGHRRLSIIDLSHDGRQPMSNEDQSCRIIFNGEIYNYKELREELEILGHRFHSSTDTEVILHLYEELGIDCVQRLRGMFAFALWDGREHRLLLARDRVGQKPLFYTITSEAILFASEIKSLLQYPGLLREVDDESIHHFLTYGYIPGSRSIFRGIFKLPQAHILTWHQGHFRITRYWDSNYKEKLILPTQKSYEEKFLQIFEEAVRIRLRSDVPLGAFLSGGLDSSATVAVMSKMLKKPVKTFSIGFEEQAYNELPYAREVAALCRTDHKEFIVKPDAVDVLAKLIWYYNEPFADSSAIPTYYLARYTSQYVTVALSGDGGDESFAGYERYKADKLACFCDHFPSFLSRKNLQQIVNSIPGGNEYKSFMRRVKRFLSAVADTPDRRYVRWLCFFDNESKLDNKGDILYSAEWKQRFQNIDSVDLAVRLYHQSLAANHLDKTLYVDLHSYLPDDLMVKVDVATMANSLEARSPFLDHKLIEFAASLPTNLKLKGLHTKFLLKKALQTHLPKKILCRSKMGFGVPIDRWLREDLREMSYDLLLDTRCIQRGYFNRAGLKKLLDSHVSGEKDHSYRIWALLVLEMWHRMFIDEKITNLSCAFSI